MEGVCQHTKELWCMSNLSFSLSLSLSHTSPCTDTHLHTHRNIHDHTTTHTHTHTHTQSHQAKQVTGWGIATQRASCRWKVALHSASRCVRCSCTLALRTLAFANSPGGLLIQIGRASFIMCEAIMSYGPFLCVMQVNVVHLVVGLEKSSHLLKCWSIIRWPVD